MSQKQQVENILLNTGEISRNICIRELYITRLSAIIQDLETEGWEFNPQWVKYDKGKDFVYYAVKVPYKKIIYTIPELDRQIITYKK